MYSRGCPFLFPRTVSITQTAEGKRAVSRPSAVVGAPGWKPSAHASPFYCLGPAQSGQAHMPFWGAPSSCIRRIAHVLNVHGWLTNRMYYVHRIPTILCIYDCYPCAPWQQSTYTGTSALSARRQSPPPLLALPACIVPYIHSRFQSLKGACRVQACPRCPPDSS